MATSPSVVRAGLVAVTAAMSTDLLGVASEVAPDRRADAVLGALPTAVPAYYDAAGGLSVAWYDELRSEAQTASPYAAQVIGDSDTAWIEREVEAFRRTLDLADATAADRLLALTLALARKEAARGFRDTTLGNTRSDPAAIGWSRVTRGGACKFCQMLAGKRTLYRSESTAIFAAHPSCHCAARPEFKGGGYGPEANAIQYEASSKRARDDETQAKRNAGVRKYLNENYPDARG